MKRRAWLATAMAWAVGVIGAPAADGPIRLLVVTGGHSYDTNEFLTMFKELPGVTFEAVAHPDAQAKFSTEAAKNYDVIVLYDMWQKIDVEAQQNLLARVREGKGLVALHHSIANYQDWPEYARLIGARYYLKPTVVDGVPKARSIWKHDVDMKVRIADPDHPVTKGIKDFSINDETYKLYDVDPKAHVLITTDEPTSEPKIGWAREDGPTRVVYIQLGHGAKAYATPEYRQLLRQAIGWTVRRP